MQNIYCIFTLFFTTLLTGIRYTDCVAENFLLGKEWLMMEYVLTTAALRKCYGSSTALQNVSIHIPKGAIYGFVGKNGAGKTTLIRLICGLQTPTSGEYTLFGRSFRDREFSKSRRRMGAIVETPAVYLNRTAEDNLKLQYRILGLPSFQNIPELLKLVGLENTGKKRRHNSPWACANVWASPWLSRETLIFWCWMNPPTVWILRESWKCGSSS